ncbi:hypothetical protein ACWCXB_27980 [Streptomyces sp. NPDC001514]
MATAEWVDWYNHRRLHGEIGHVPPVEYEAIYTSRTQNPSSQPQPRVSIKPETVHTPLCRYNSRPGKLTGQPIELTNRLTVTPKREHRSSQTRPAPARKQRQAPRQHTAHRQAQPAN